jgi:hypothetical protein
VGRVTEPIQIAGGVVLQDVTDALPRHPTKRWARRPLAGIRRLYVHHSGALGREGYEGMAASARYEIRHRDGDKPEPGWPGFAYHFWLPHDGTRDGAGRLVVYRGNPDAARVYHTGGRCNVHGIGVCLQGNLTRTGPSPSQVELLEALLPWLLERYRLTLPDGLSWHSDSKRFGGTGKPACPGPAVVRWLEAYKLEHAAPLPAA